MRAFKDYQGRTIRLTDERLHHVLEHPEMAGLETDIGQAVSRPQLACRSRTDESAVLNYRLLPTALFGDKWLCVVVKYSENDAFVLTAYLTDRPKKGTQVWPEK